jgi:RNA polymerase sigma-70 factor (ECF subfamily)
MGRRNDEFERTALPHAPSLLRFALRLARNRPNAEDLVQEALLLAWRAFPRFEPGSARAWLFRILINLFLSQNRKARSAPPVLLLKPENQAALHSHCESLEVIQALDRLSAEQRTVLLLAVVEGFTCREISEILSIPIGTVMSRLARARDAMREVLAPAKVVR